MSGRIHRRRRQQRRPQYDRAAALFGEAVGLLDTSFPTGHPLTANTEFAFGRMRFRQSLFDEALPHLERAVSLRVAVLGEENVRTADARLWLGRCLTSLGRTDEAVIALTSAHKALAAAQGPDSAAAREAAEALAKVPARQ